MLKIKVNGQFEFEVLDERNQKLVNGVPVEIDLYPVNAHTFHVLYRNRSFDAELIELNKEERTCIVKINSNRYSMTITDQFDQLLHQLGMDNLNALKVSDMKAPMPGMVLKILVSEGEEVKKGGNLLVLEAMKMENIIKSPADVTIKSIKVKPSDKVEKNQVMLVFA